MRQGHHAASSHVQHSNWQQGQYQNSEWKSAVLQPLTSDLAAHLASHHILQLLNVILQPKPVCCHSQQIFCLQQMQSSLPLLQFSMCLAATAPYHWPWMTSTSGQCHTYPDHIITSGGFLHQVIVLCLHTFCKQFAVEYSSNWSQSLPAVFWVQITASSLSAHIIADSHFIPNHCQQSFQICFVNCHALLKWQIQQASSHPAWPQCSFPRTPLSPTVFQALSAGSQFPALSDWAPFVSLTVCCLYCEWSPSRPHTCTLPNVLAAPLTSRQIGSCMRKEYTLHEYRTTSSQLHFLLAFIYIASTVREVLYCCVCTCIL